jgi:hypothetical protein
MTIEVALLALLSGVGVIGLLETVETGKWAEVSSGPEALSSADHWLPA